MGVLNLADAKRITGTDDPTEDETETLEEMIEAVNVVIEDRIGPVNGSRTWVCSATPNAIRLPYRFAAVVSVTVDGATVDPDRYDGVSGARIGVLRATGAAPWASGGVVEVEVDVDGMQANVRLAASELLSHWWELAQQAGRAAWVGGEGGGFSPSSYAVPNRVVELLNASPGLPGFA